MSSGSALVGVDVPGVIVPYSTLRIAIRLDDPSEIGVSKPGLLGTDVGAVE